jgi:hypothetical protein
VGPRAGLEGRGKFPTGILSPGVQPAASRFTDWAIPALNSPDTLEVIETECKVIFPPLCIKEVLKVKGARGGAVG